MEVCTSSKPTWGTAVTKICAELCDSADAKHWELFPRRSQLLFSCIQSLFQSLFRRYSKRYCSSPGVSQSIVENALKSWGCAKRYRLLEENFFWLEWSCIQIKWLLPKPAPLRSSQLGGRCFVGRDTIKKVVFGHSARAQNQGRLADPKLQPSRGFYDTKRKQLTFTAVLEPKVKVAKPKWVLHTWQD